MKLATSRLRCNDFGCNFKILVLKTVPENTNNEEKDDSDSMRTDSVDRSSGTASSPTSVEIFLPQMEGTCYNYNFLPCEVLMLNMS